MSKRFYSGRSPKYMGEVAPIGMLSPRRFTQWQVDQLEEIASAIRNGIISEVESYKYCQQVKDQTYRGIP